MVRCDLQVAEHEASRAEAAAVATQMAGLAELLLGPRGLLSPQLPPGLAPEQPSWAARRKELEGKEEGGAQRALPQ